MRWLLVALVGCAYHRGTAVTDDAIATGSDAAHDAAPLDAPPDALVHVQYIQSVGADAAAAVIMATMPAAQTAGDLDVVALSWPDTTISLLTVTDSDGNSFVQVGTGVALVGHGVLAVYVAANVRQGTVPATLTQPTTPTLVVAEYRGLIAANVVEGTQANAMTSGAMLDSGPVATTHNHDLVIGAVGSSVAIVAGTGFTSRVDQSNTMIEDREVTSAGSYDATATKGASNSWFARVVALKAN